MIQPIQPMLLQPKPQDVTLQQLQALKNTIGELKRDGERIAGYKTPTNEVYVWNREGALKNSHYPEIVLDMKMVKENDFILDGEAVVRQGKPGKDYQDLQSRSKTQNPTNQDLCDKPVTYVVFDIIKRKSQNLHMTKLWERKQILREFFRDNVFELARCQESQFTFDLDWLWKKVLDEHWEGICLKDIGSYYLFGKKSYNILKYKPKKLYKATVTSYNSKKRVISSLITPIGNVTLQPILENQKLIPQLFEQIPKNNVKVEIEGDYDLTPSGKIRFPVLKKLIIEEKIYEQT